MRGVRIPRGAPLGGGALAQWERYADLATSGRRKDALDVLCRLADELTDAEAERLTAWYCRMAFETRVRHEIGMNAVICERVLLPALLRRTGAGDATALLWLVLLVHEFGSLLWLRGPELRRRSRETGLRVLALLRNPDSPAIWRLLHYDELDVADWGMHHLVDDELLVLALEEIQEALARARVLEDRAPPGALSAGALAERRELDALLDVFLVWRTTDRSMPLSQWLDEHVPGWAGDA